MSELLRRTYALAAVVVFAAFLLVAGAACHGDQKMIDRHEQTLAEEDD